MIHISYTYRIRIVYDTYTIRIRRVYKPVYDYVWHGCDVHLLVALYIADGVVFLGERLYRGIEHCGCTHGDRAHDD